MNMLLPTMQRLLKLGHYYSRFYSMAVGQKTSAMGKSTHDRTQLIVRLLPTMGVFSLYNH